jgi:RNA polymerase primary sigma factor
MPATLEPTYDAVTLYLHDLRHHVLPPGREPGLWDDVVRARRSDATEAERDAGERACALLIAHHARLVPRIAARYQHLGLPLADLIQEGNMGLMRATQTHDPSIGAFSTYATFAIRQKIIRATERQATTIAIPVNVTWDRRTRNKARARLTQLLGREPTEEELDAEHGPEGAGAAHADAARRMASLDALVAAAEGDVALVDVLPDLNVTDPADDLARATEATSVRELLHDRLSPRDAAIVRAIHGLDGPRRTLEQVGVEYGLSRERVRQIVARAVETLRAHIDPAAFGR